MKKLYIMLFACLLIIAGALSYHIYMSKPVHIVLHITSTYKQLPSQRFTFAVDRHYFVNIKKLMKIYSTTINERKDLTPSQINRAKRIYNSINKILIASSTQNNQEITRTQKVYNTNEFDDFISPFSLCVAQIAQAKEQNRIILISNYEDILMNGNNLDNDIVNARVNPNFGKADSTAKVTQYNYAKYKFNYLDFMKTAFNIDLKYFGPIVKK